MTSPFIHSLTTRARAAVQQSIPAMPAAPVTPQFGSNKKQYNPFMAALNTDTPEFREVYGVNRPLSKPMFLGYRDDQPVFGGSRLFILY